MHILPQSNNSSKIDFKLDGDIYPPHCCNISLKKNNCFFFFPKPRCCSWMCLSFLHICPFVLNCVIVTSSAYSFLPLISSCSLSLFRTPEQCPSVVSLLSESYNPHVRCGAAMALGICCAGTGNKVSASSLTPLLFKWGKKTLPRLLRSCWLRCKNEFLSAQALLDLLLITEINIPPKHVYKKAEMAYFQPERQRWSCDPHLSYVLSLCLGVTHASLHKGVSFKALN